MYILHVNFIKISPMKYNIRVNSKNGVFLKHFWYTLFLGSRVPSNSCEVPGFFWNSGHLWARIVQFKYNTIAPISRGKKAATIHACSKPTL